MCFVKWKHNGQVVNAHGRPSINPTVKVLDVFRLNLVMCVYTKMFHHHHHHWLDSSWWTLAFLRSFAHSSLLRANFFQFLTPNILISWSKPSSYRSFGLPALLAPFGLVLNISLRVLSLFIRTKCPAHASLLTLI